jgi:hypothetical protein
MAAQTAEQRTHASKLKVAEANERAALKVAADALARVATLEAAIAEAVPWLERGRGSEADRVLRAALGVSRDSPGGTR